MSGSNYDSVAIESLDQFEIQVSSTEPSVSLFVTTGNGQKLVLDFPASAWAEFLRAMEATKEKFPRGRIEH